MPRFLRPFRSKDKDSDAGSGSRSKSRNRNELSQFQPRVWVPPGTHPLTGRLDQNILELILHHVSPHSSDDKYRSFEESNGVMGDGCVLCETRDLAACMGVNKNWRRVAEKRLYKNIRFECIHYCPREDWLREHRKNKSKPEKTDDLRLQLLVRTFREYHNAAQAVEVLKLPYQIREGHQGELARLVSRTAYLRYIDLPNGFFADSPTYSVLKQELMAGCPDLRFMKYVAGGEGSFARHAYEDLWYNLEVVSLEDMDLEPDVLTYALARMLNLSKLNLSNMGVLTDSIFQASPNLPALPAVRTLRIANAPRVTAHGILEYLRRPEVVNTITTLQLEDTGVQVTDVHMLLATASKLRNFTIHTKVAHAMTANSAPLISSRSIRQIYFEISNETNYHSVGNMPCDSYYDYLASSIASKSLPSIRSVRVYCPQFPDLLVSLAPPPTVGFDSGAGGAGGLPNPSGLRPAALPPPNPGMPPRLSALPGSLAPPALPSPGLPPSMANRMSSLSLGPGGPPSHVRSHSSAAPYLGPPGAASLSQRPSSSYGMGYNPSPFSPSPVALAQASAPEPSVPSDVVARLGITGSGGLMIYTKPPNAEEMEWLVTEFVPPVAGAVGRPGSSGGIRGARPVSLMGIQPPGKAGAAAGAGTGTDPDLSWLGDAPATVTGPGRGMVGSHGGQLVGNGFGGYIEVKDEGKKGRRKGADWMG